MMTVNATAANQYANRPKDQSFATMADMVAVARHEQDTSKTVSYNLRDLHIAPTADPRDGTMLPAIVSPKGAATFSHWSFGQFCRMVGAPAGYLRTLPPQNIANDLNHGIIQTPAGSTVSLLVKAPNGNPLPTVRAASSETYDRVWDAQLYGAADQMLFQHTSVSGQPWIAPPTWSGEPAGTWRGDRDSFVIRVDGGSIVEDPSIPNNQDGRMFRGIMMRNSEVGASSIQIDWVLFQFICGNLNLWGAVTDRTFKRRHVGSHTLRHTLRELGQMARQWTNRPASQDEAIIRQLVSTELAHTADGVIDELRKIGYTKEQAQLAVQTCETHFAASPRSYWGLAQGTTKMSQTADYQDDRYALDQLAAKVMARGAKRIAA